jgi:UDP-2,3-diacylglucosamine hydrolase
MIHGHTHRPTVHYLDVDGTARQRIVLADWHDDSHEYLEVVREGFLRKTVPL